MIFFKSILAVEASLCVTAFATFVTLRRSESTRRTVYEKCPSLANFYYYTEDLMSYGQLAGTRIKHRDIHRWV
uniref:Secreted protein n=1 Tax=Strongyloides venezuelensis TaxID=75913 RepID=A0A0K0G416_STRVS